MSARCFTPQYQVSIALYKEEQERQHPWLHQIGLLLPGTKPRETTLSDIQVLQTTKKGVGPTLDAASFLSEEERNLLADQRAEREER